ncbi:MAG TPA: hypothetical protein DIT97_00560, partial [Gimesia maris]|nr:hypothetical protein [Gimesia maris]
MRTEDHATIRIDQIKAEIEYAAMILKIGGTSSWCGLINGGVRFKTSELVEGANLFLARARGIEFQENDFFFGVFRMECLN